MLETLFELGALGGEHILLNALAPQWEKSA